MTDITTTVVHDLSWIKGHLILLAVVVVLVFGAVYEVENLLEKRTAAEAAKWQSILSAQQQHTQILEDKLTADEKNWAVVQAALVAQNSKLETGIQQRDMALRTQQQKDVTLSAQEVAQKLTQQTGASPNEITPQSDSILVDLPIGRVLVSDLDLLQTTQADLSDTKNQLSNEVKFSDNLQANLNEEKTLNASLQQQNADQTKSCQAQIADLKAKARKSKLKWFGAGFVAGLISAHFLGI